MVVRGRQQLQRGRRHRHDQIDKANAIITVTPYNVTYDSDPHTAAGSATGVESRKPRRSERVCCDLSGTTHTNAGNYPANAWTFAGNSNYNAASGTVHDQIDKATRTSP